MTDLVKWLRESEARLPVIRTHGDFHLGRTARTDQGWVVSDCAPGGVAGRGSPPCGRRTPLGDVADLLWSMHQASAVAAAERDPTGRLGLAALGHGLGDAEPAGLRDGLSRHRRASAGLVGPDRDLVRRLVSFLELARSVRDDPDSMARRPGRRP